jgi:hypothetical protein
MEQVRAREARFVSQEAIAVRRRPEGVSQRHMHVLFGTNRIAQENERSGLVVPFNVSYPFTRRRAEFKASEEIGRVAEGGKPWIAYDSGVSKYERAFVEVWGVMGQSFGDFLRIRRARKGQTYVMDVMGTGGFLPHYQGLVDGEVMITLVDHRPEEVRMQDAANNRLMIAGPNDVNAYKNPAQARKFMQGDVTRNAPWLRAGKFITEYDDTDLPGFDLITCRPIAGWSLLREGYFSNKDHAKLMDWIPVQRMYGLLSKNGGTLLVKMASYGNYGRWFDSLQSTKGIYVMPDFQTGALRITKGENPPKILPRIP